MCNGFEFDEWVSGFEDGILGVGWKGVKEVDGRDLFWLILFFGLISRLFIFWRFVVGRVGYWRLLLMWLFLGDEGNWGDDIFFFGSLG